MSPRSEVLVDIPSDDNNPGRGADMTSIGLPTIHNSPRKRLASHQFISSSSRESGESPISGNIANKENEPLDRNIPISAPIPISHSALGKEAFKSILSTGEEEQIDDSQAHISTSSTQSAADVHTPATQIPERELATYDQQPSAGTASRAQVYVEDNIALPESDDGPARLIIRPATPSTMMALTEPCLFAWCLDYNPQEGIAQVPYTMDASQQQLDLLSPHSAGASVSAASVTHNTTRNGSPIETMTAPQIAYPETILDPDFAQLQWTAQTAGGRNMWGY